MISTQRLVLAYAGHFVHILDQRSLLPGDIGLPEPDLAVIRGRSRDYLTRHPAAADALLVIEIAKSSQARDRAKAADYARGGAPIYWLVDLESRRLDLYEGPIAEVGRYRSVSSLSETEMVSLPRIDLRWTVASLLP